VFTLVTARTLRFPPYRGVFLKCFRPFVASWPAPSASGRSESGRVGISPTGLVHLRQGTHNNSGWNSGDLTVLGGAAGWHLTVSEVLSVMGAFRRGGNILTPPAAQAMLDNGFGIDPLIYPVEDDQPFPAGAPTPAGEMYCKNGRWYDSATASRREEQALAYFLPNNIEFVIFANSPFPGADITQATFRDAVTPIILNSFRPLPPTVATLA
jgi:hypothetical protein